MYALTETDKKLYKSLLDYDKNTAQHCLRVALYAENIGKKENCNSEILFKAGLLHDIGKMKVPKKILNKKGALNQDERIIINNHAYWGYKMLKEENYDDNICLMVLLHHGLLSSIPETSRLEIDSTAIYDAGLLMSCDIFDALTSTRPYRQALNVDQAINILRSNGASSKVTENFNDEMLMEDKKFNAIFNNIISTLTSCHQKI